MDFVLVLLQVIPIALTAALAPFNVSLVILLLLSKEKPVARAVAFLSGFTASLVVVGGLGLGIMSSLHLDPTRVHGYFVITVLGAILILLGIRQFVTKTDVDAPPSRWLEHFIEVPAWSAFGIGLFLSAFGLKTLIVYATTLGIIGSAGLAFPATFILTALVVVTIISTMLLPIIVYVARPVQGAQLLQAVRVWLDANQQYFGSAVLVIVGATLLFLGIRGMYRVP